jgi:hypothetical protein
MGHGLHKHQQQPLAALVDNNQLEVAERLSEDAADGLDNSFRVVVDAQKD